MGHSGSLKRLLLRHELALLLLVVVTVALGGAWGYVWQQASRESVRLNNQIHIALQVRSDLYRQIKEVTEARLTEDPRALELYQQYSRRIARHLNALRSGTKSRDEEMAIQHMGLAYRVIQHDMNRSFIDPFAINAAARLKILDRRYEELLLADFEKAQGSYLDLLNAQREVLLAQLERYSNWARIVIPLPILLAVALFVWSRASIQRGFVRPVAEVISGALKMSQGQLDHRIPEQGAEEMANLARAINGMARDLAASRDALVEKERQAALGALVPVVAHNIRNPLASIRATAQMIDEDRPEEVQEARQAIIQTVDRLERWVRSLLSYLHPLQPRCSRVRLGRVVEEALVLLQPRLEEKGVTVTRRGWDSDPEVLLDVDLAEQAVYGLLTNAVDASPVGAAVTVRLGRADAHWRLGIEDEGPGMPFDPQPRGLTPGPTTKRSGTGLGIPFAYKVCQAHGWGLEFTSRPGGGTVATIHIPMTEQAYVEQP